MQAWPSPLTLRAALVTVAGALSCALPPVSAYAQAYPSRNVQMIVPYTAGGSIDLYARAISAELEGFLPKEIERYKTAAKLAGIEPQ